MVNPEIQKDIMNDLAKLPVDLQKKVQDFTHSLVDEQRKGVPGKDLLTFSGIMNDADAAELEEIITEGCWKIDYNEW